MNPEVSELLLFIENDGDLYRSQTQPIITNLQKMFTKGTYKHDAAVKLWKHLADNGAKKYEFEHVDRHGKRYWQEIPGFGIFTPQDRKEVAALLADRYFEQVQEGYAFKTTRRKNPEIHVDINSHNAPGRARNPAKRGAPRKGTKAPTRKSQITGKKPTVRLVRRRQANVKKGYFPNPTLSQKAAEIFVRKVSNAVSEATVKHKDPVIRQAKISYAQGMVDAAYMTKMIDSAHATDLLRRVQASME